MSAADKISVGQNLISTLFGQVNVHSVIHRISKLLSDYANPEMPAGSASWMMGLSRACGATWIMA